MNRRRGWCGQLQRWLLYIEGTCKVNDTSSAGFMKPCELLGRTELSVAQLAFDSQQDKDGLPQLLELPLLSEAGSLTG